MDKQIDQITSEPLLHCYKEELRWGHYGYFYALELGEYPERLEVLHFPSHQEVVVSYGEKRSSYIGVPKGFNPKPLAMTQFMVEHYPDRFFPDDFFPDVLP